MPYLIESPVRNSDYELLILLLNYVILLLWTTNGIDEVSAVVLQPTIVLDSFFSDFVLSLIKVNLWFFLHVGPSAKILFEVPKATKHTAFFGTGDSLIMIMYLLPFYFSLETTKYGGIDIIGNGIVNIWFHGYWFIL